MNIAILGYGMEGKAAKNYFDTHDHQTTVFQDFTAEQLNNFNLDSYDLVLRSPSVPLKTPTPSNWSSSTNYFFEHCPAPIIGVTGTKGKGTVSTIIAAIISSIGKTVHLVGNIGTPALSLLDQIKKDHFVVFELSSFQAWDLKTSPVSPPS